MTDPSTLFLSSPQIRPSWTINGLTLELNLAPTAGGATAVSEGNNYATQTFQGIHPSNATTGTVFASVVGQGQCSTPLRLAVRGGTSCWTQAAPSEPVATGMPTVVGDSIFAITQSAAFLSTGLSANANGHTLNGTATATAAAATAASIPSGNAAAAATFVPSNAAVLEQSLCQLQQLMAKGLLNPATPATNTIVSSGTVVGAPGGGYFVTAGPPAVTTVTANGNFDTKKKELTAVTQPSATAPVERRKRQKPLKNCAVSVMVAPQQPANEMTAANVTAVSGVTSNAYTLYELPPSSVPGSTNGGSADGTLGIAGSLHVSVTDNSLLSPTTTTMSPSDHKSLGAARPFRPIAVKRDANGTPCQVAEITTSSLNNKTDHSTATGTVCGKRESDLALTTSMGTTVPSSQLAQLTTSTQSTSVATNAIAATGATVMSNGGIPVGIAVARQRFVSNTSGKSQTATSKDVIATSSAAATSYSSIVPYQQTLIEPSMFASSISNIGVVAGATSCEDRSGTNVGAGIPPPIIAWPTSTGLPQQQHHTTQQWNPYAAAGLAEAQIQNMPSTCAGYQLARDPVTGQIVLIPANQIDSMPQQTAFIIPGGAQTSTTGYSSTSQQIQSYLISQPPSQAQQQQQQQHHHQQKQQQQHQPASHSLFLDRLVTIVPSTNVNAKQKPVPSTILKLDDGPITGVMMPCDLGKTSSMNSTNATAAIGQQLISNNSSFSLVQQFNASNIHNPNLNMPHHFSSISSSGSLLIQQISGNSGPPPLINQVNNSVVIAESAATQSVINSQSQYQPSNTSYLINTQQISSENSTIIDQVQPTPCLIPVSAAQPNFSQFPAVSVDDSLQQQSLKSSTVVQMSSSSSVAPIKRVDVETKTITGANQTVDEVCSSRATSDEYSVDKSGEEAVIKVDTNSSVQDASNQTDSMISFGDEDDDGEDNDDDEDVLRIHEECEEPGRDRKEDDNELADSRPAALPETKVYSVENPDFSGLQLLLNGIERVEHSRISPIIGEEVACKQTEAADVAQTLPQPNKETEDGDIEKPVPNSLEILCALADQRFKEEKEVAESDEESSSSDSELKKQSRKEVPIKREVGHQYRSLASKQETRRFLSSKYTKQQLCSLSPNEAQIRMQHELAKLQKKYRETKKELNRLSHRKYTSSSSATRSPTPCFEQPSVVSHDSDAAKAKIATPAKRRPGRPRKCSLEQADGGPKPSHRPTVKPMKRPTLKFESSKSFLHQGSDDESKVSKLNNGDLSPPVLEPMCSSPKAKPFKSDILSPPTLIPSKKSFLGSKGLLDKEPNVKKPLFRLSSPDDSSDEEPEYCKRASKAETSLSMSRGTASAAPKRKVGRPRKYPRDDGVDEPIAKKPKTAGASRSSSGGTTVTNKFPKDKRPPSTYNKISEKQVPVTSSVVSTFAMLKSQRRSSDYTPEVEVESKPKITPKLKAEAKLKKWHDSPEDNIKDDLDLDFTTFVKRKVDLSDNVLLYKDRKDPFDKRDKSHSTKVRDFTSSVNFTNSSRISSPSSTEYCNEDFRITSNLLESAEKRPLRVLISVGGLFRAGELKAIQPPDLYGIKLDGERGQRTHIYTKEEVLRDVVLEVRGRFPLRSGTRVCAFWSSQYLSLYPGYVTSFSSSDESEDENFTAVSFDDGDSGRIRINDIRLLPKDFSFSRHYDYTTAENDGKRKRRSSTMSFEEIPMDKQLHSPESPSLYRDSSSGHDQNGHGTTSPSYDSSSRSSFHNENIPSKNKPPEEKSEDLSVVCKEKSSSSERKRLKKKRKDKLRENFGGGRSSSSSSSCKRKSHKHRSDSDELSNGKSHKRHKHHHKHKHHKHHKKHKSQSDNDNKKLVASTGGDFVNSAASAASVAGAPAVAASFAPRPVDQPMRVASAGGADRELQPAIVGDLYSSQKESKSKWASAMYSPRFSDPLKESKLSAVADAVSLVEKSSKKAAKPDAFNNLVEKSKPLASGLEDDENSKITCDDDVASVSSDEKPESDKTDDDTDDKMVIDEDAELAELEESKKTESDDEKSDNEADKSTLSKVNESTDLNSSEDAPLSKTTEEDDEDVEEDQEDEECERSNDERDAKLWDWHGKGFKRNGRGRGRKQFYKSIKRGPVIINVDDCAVFLTENGSSDKPFIGRIESMWEANGMMWVRVNWFYHPEETEGLNKELPFRGGLFESLHDDKNDIQTISHKCNVVPIDEFRDLITKEPDRLESIYTKSDLYYLAGHYDVKTKSISFCDGVVSS